MRKFLGGIRGIFDDPRWSEAAAERQEQSLPTTMNSVKEVNPPDASSGYLMQKIFPEISDNIPHSVYQYVLEVNGLAFRHAVICHTKARTEHAAEDYLRHEQKTEAANAWKEVMKLEHAMKVTRNLVLVIIKEMLSDEALSDLYKVLLGDDNIFNMIVSPAVFNPISEQVAQTLQANYDLAVNQMRISPFVAIGQGGIDSPDGTKFK